MEQPNNDTFCVAPWFQIRNENNMQKKVCCNIQTSTENHENKTALDFLNIDENIKLKKETPSLKDILELINYKKNFSSEYVTKSQKEYFLENFKSIEIFKGTSSEIAFITKK